MRETKLQIQNEGAAEVFVNMWPLTEYEKDMLRESVIRKRYPKNSMIYRRGEPLKYVMFIEEGRVKIFRNSDGGQPKIIRIFRDGQFFGYRAFFSDENYTTDCVAMDRATVLQIPANILSRLIETNKTVMRFFYRELAIGLGLSDDRLVNMVQKHLRGRLAETLIFLAHSFGIDNNGWTNGKTTRSDIANLANMTTSNAIRTLTKFRSEGLIETDGKKIRINDIDKLEHIADNE